jgi:hypothetical protein
VPQACKGHGGGRGACSSSPSLTPIPPNCSFGRDCVGIWSPERFSSRALETPLRPDSFFSKKISARVDLRRTAHCIKDFLRLETDAQAHFFFSSAGLSPSLFICPSREPCGSYSLERKGLDLPVICVENGLCLVLEAVAILWHNF